MVSLAGKGSKKKANKFSISTLLCHLYLIFLSFFMALPILWSFITSIKHESIVRKYPPEIIPSKFDFGNYYRAFTEQPIFKYLGNSFFYAIVSTLIAAFIATLAAYAFSRYKFKGKKVVLGLLLFAMMMRGATNLIPLYKGLSVFRMIDKHATLVALYIPGLLPFSVFLLQNFFDSIPFSIEEAAMIDGCSRFKIVTRIVIPTALPGILAVIVINFVTIWNDLLIGLIFTHSEATRPITFGIFNFIGYTNIDQGAINATVIASILPVLILFVLMRDKFMSSMTDGAVKG